MVFAPNMTQMADPLTALMYAVQVMNFLKTLILQTLRDRQVAALDPRPDSSCRDPYDENDHDNAPLGLRAKHEQGHNIEDDENACGSVESPLDGYSHSTEDESVNDVEESFLTFGEKDISDADGIPIDGKVDDFSPRDSLSNKLRKTRGIEGFNVSDVFGIKKGAVMYNSENDHEGASTSEGDSVVINEITNDSFWRNNADTAKGAGKQCTQCMVQVMQPTEKSKGRSVINQINQQIERAEAWR